MERLKGVRRGWDEYEMLGEYVEIRFRENGGAPSCFKGDGGGRAKIKLREP